VLLYSESEDDVGGEESDELKLAPLANNGYEPPAL
jgi:hypothetical protein